MGIAQTFRSALAAEVVGWGRTIDPNAFPDYPSYWRNIPVVQSPFSLDFPRAVAAIPIVYACIDLLATDAASLPVRFFRRLPDGKREPLERQSGNIVDLWERWNPTQSRYEGTVELQSSLDTAGNAFLFIETFGSDKPTKDWELWHMPPHTVKPTVTGHRMPVAYEFMGGVAPILLDAKRVIHFRYHHPQFFPLGLSPLESARIAYESRYLGDRWKRQLYERGGQVGHMFEMPADGVNRDPKWIKSEQKRMAETSGGIANVGLPTILQGMKFVRAGLTPAEMGFVEMMRQIDTDVCLALGVPPSVLNIRTGGSLSDAGVSVDWVRYWENAQKRRARLRDAVVTKHLCSRFGPDIECETDFSSVPAIQEQLLKQMKSLVISTGRPVLDVNEARRPLADVFGVGPRDDETEEADKLFLPSAPEAGMPEPKGGEEPAGSGPGEEGEDALGQVTGITDGEVKPRPGKAAKSAQADRMKEAALIERVRARKRASALLARYERRFERAMRAFFTAQEERTLKNLESAWTLAGLDTGRAANGNGKRNGVSHNGNPKREGGHIDWHALLDAGGHVDAAALERLFAELMDQRGEDQLAELGVEVEIELNKAATTNYAGKQAAALITKIDETTRTKLRAQLGEVLQAGGTYTEAYAAVQGVFDGRRGNAATIARTEMAGAYNYASLDAARQSGVVTGKSWLTTDDELVRESHTECEAQGDIGIDEAFVNELDFPGDPDGDADEVCNCRCTLLYATDDARVRRLKERVAATGRKVRMADPLPDVPLEDWLCLKS